MVSGIGPLLAPGADAVAVSQNWVVWRAGQSLHAASLDPIAEREVVAGNVGRPALSFNTLVFDIDGQIESVDLVSGARTLLRRQARAQLRGPSILGNEIAYVIATNRRQQVRLGPLRPQQPASDPNLYGTTPTGRRDPGYEPGHKHAEGHSHAPLWDRPPLGITDTLTTTAVAPDAVYFTRVRKTPGLAPSAVVLRVDRPPVRRR
jgi:hypothetical protein